MPLETTAEADIDALGDERVEDDAADIVVAETRDEQARPPCRATVTAALAAIPPPTVAMAWDRNFSARVGMASTWNTWSRTEMPMQSTVAMGRTRPAEAADGPADHLAQLLCLIQD